MTKPNGEDKHELIVVCILAEDDSPWKATNLFGNCRDCGAAVQFRPNAPNAPKICLPCWRRIAQSGDVIEVSATSIAEVETYRRRN